MGRRQFLEENLGAAAAAPQRWRPHAYQVKAMRWLLSHGGAGLFLDPGLGKTSINLGAIKVLKAEGEIRRGALVVCELRPLYNVWDPRNPDSEPAKWTDFHGLKFEMLHGPGKDAALRRRADVYLINPEGLDWYFRSASSRTLPEVLIIDESTRFKNTSSERFSILRPWLPRFSRRWINTGTPSPNGLEDLFGQVFILDLGNALGFYVTNYRRRFFQPSGWGGYKFVLKGEGDREQKRTERLIYRAIEPLVLRMSEDDYLKLPRIHGSLSHGKRIDPSFTIVDLPPAARAKYDLLEEQFFLELDDGLITSANAAVKHMKLRQAGNGGIYLDRELDDEGRPKPGKRKWARIHDAKAEATVELLEEMDMAAVIAVEFHHDLERLRMQRHLRNVVAIGEGSIKDDVLIARDWNAGRVREVVVNPSSFARGSNMQRGGDALIWHSLIWNFEDYDQLVRRFWRQGRTRPFYVKHVIARGTQDMVVARGLQRKNTTQRSLLDALRDYSLRRPKGRARH